MFGWIAAAHQVGAASAAWASGLVRTGTGSYLAAFVAAGILCLAASLMVLFVGVGRDGEWTGVTPRPLAEGA